MVTSAFRRVLLVQAGGKDFLEAIHRSIHHALDDHVRVLELTLVLGDDSVDVDNVAAIITEAHADTTNRRAVTSMVQAVVDAHAGVVIRR